MKPYTPGPWKSNSMAVEFTIYAQEPYSHLAIVAGPNDEANARLIAAAPELLEAGREALKHLEHVGDCRHDPDPTYDSTGHIMMGRLPCPVCMLERAIARAMVEKV